MSSGDFYGNELAALIGQAGTLRIEFTPVDGKATVLKDGIKVQAAELISTTFMHAEALRTFFEAQIQDAKARGLLLSLHLKATMMKVSDPIKFGHAVTVYYKGRVRQACGVVRPAGRRSEQRHRGCLREDPVTAAGGAGAGRNGPRRHLPVAPAAGDGGFGQGDHEPARAQRRHRRRQHACRHPQLRPHVGSGRQGT